MDVKTKRRWRENITGYSFILPNFLGFLVFTSVPVVVSFCLAFSNWDIVTPANFAGLDNFKKLFSDKEFLKCLWNTIFMMSAIPISMALSLGMALVLNQKLKGRTIFRTVFFLPSITAGAAIYIVWGRLYNSEYGALGKLLPSVKVWLICVLEVLPILLVAGLILFLLTKFILELFKSKRKPRFKIFFLSAFVIWIMFAGNVILSRWLGIPPIIPGTKWIIPLKGIAGAYGWLIDPWLAKPSLMLMGFWAAMGGYSMILYLAALQNIDPELYDASEVDGANRWQKFRHIIWPLITPTTFFIFITGCIGGFQGGFESAYIMTEGGPAALGPAWTPWAGETVKETMTLSYYIFDNAYIYLKMGYAAAVAWFLFFVVFIVTMVNWRYGGRRVEY